MKLVTVASGDVFVTKNDDKHRLAKEFGADICEMELAGIAIACERNNVPLFPSRLSAIKRTRAQT